MPLYAIQLLTKKETKTLQACNLKTPLPFYPSIILFFDQFVNYLEKGFEKSCKPIIRELLQFSSQILMHCAQQELDTTRKLALPMSEC